MAVVCFIYNLMIQLMIKGKIPFHVLLRAIRKTESESPAQRYLPLAIIFAIVILLLGSVLFR